MRMKNNNKIFYKSEHSDYDEFAANFLYEKFTELQSRQKKVNIALSGGSTPLPILELLKNTNLNWSQFAFFMVDERCVSLSDPQSNYGNISRVFFKNIASQSYSMVEDGADFTDSIIRYSEKLNSELKFNKDIPAFDLILLGMGDDGHTASLFPNTEALLETEKIVVKNRIPALNSERITLTYPLLENAREAIVLIKGKVKCEIMREMYAKKAKHYPMYKLITSSLPMKWIYTE